MIIQRIIVGEKERTAKVGEGERRITSLQNCFLAVYFLNNLNPKYYKIQNFFGLEIIILLKYSQPERMCITVEIQIHCAASIWCPQGKQDFPSPHQLQCIFLMFYISLYKHTHKREQNSTCDSQVQQR